jgi:hypothetical protein
MKTLPIAVTLACLGTISPAIAGPYTDDLSRCLVEKSSTEDKTSLLQWIFVAMAQHPSVSAFTKITPDDVEKHNKAAGALFMRLLTETCNDNSKKAIKYEGAASIQLSFQVLGQAAAGELFTHPDVSKMMSGLEKYLDKAKLEALSK